MKLNLIRCLGNHIYKQRNLFNEFVRKNSSSEYAVKFELPCCPVHRLETAPNTETSLTKNEAIGLFTNMLTIRKLEKLVANLYREGMIRGSCHLYIGQEASAVGIKAALRPQDAVVTSYRHHGWVWLMGVPIIKLIAELGGKLNGVSRGKGGSMHMYAKNYYGGNGIIGAQGPIGTGLAFASKYKNNGGVAVALFGDGASNQGQIFEAYNMAALWKIPCIYVIENNRYAMFTSTERGSANNDFYTKGDFIPGVQVDGQDVLAVREATRFAVEHCKSAEGPILLEVQTYRFVGHGIADPGTNYRTKEEVEDMKKHQDPIQLLRQKIVSAGLVTEEELKKIEMAISAELDDAVKKTKEAPEAPMSEMITDIYLDNFQSNYRNTTPWNPLKHSRVGKPFWE